MANSFYRTFISYFGFGKTKPLVLQNQSTEEKHEEISGNAFKERITDDKMRHLFGVNYDGVMYYDFDGAVWKSDKYLGYSMPYQDRFEKLMWDLKRVLECEVNFAKYELVAVVTMVIKDRFFPGVGKKITHPFYGVGGKGVVGTIIRRDKESGKLLSIPCSWNGVHISRLGVCDAIWYGPKWFAEFGIENSEFRNALLRNHCCVR